MNNLLLAIFIAIIIFVGLGTIGGVILLGVHIGFFSVFYETVYTISCLFILTVGIVWGVLTFDDD